jgi:hypothetical protein
MTRIDDKDSPLGDLVSPAHQLVEICDESDKASRSLLCSNPPSSQNIGSNNFKNTRNINMSGTESLPTIDFASLGKSREELEKILPKFSDVLTKINALGERRMKEEKSIADWLRELAKLAGIYTARNLSAEIDDLIKLVELTDGFCSKAKEATCAFSKLEKTAALKTEATAVKKGEDAPEGFMGLSDKVGKIQSEIKPVTERYNHIVEAFGNSSYENYDSAIAKWETFKEEVLDVRKAALDLPGAAKESALSDFALNNSKRLPDWYRGIDTDSASLAVQRLLKKQAEDFASRVAAVDAAQPPFDRINAASINISGFFPSEIIVGRESAFSAEIAKTLAGLGVPGDIPYGIDFPFSKPLVYDSADLIQMLVLRMAQALPQGLFEAYAIDSENAGRTFREIAELRKMGILTVSLKVEDDERIISELDTWLGDLPDRGCWDWSDYNRNHKESPLPYKFVLLPSFGSLDSMRLSIVSKLAKIGPSSGLVMAFSKQAIASLDRRDGETAAKTLAEMSSGFDDMDYLLVSNDDSTTHSQDTKDSSLKDESVDSSHEQSDNTDNDIGCQNEDELYEAALDVVRRTHRASTSSLQRALRIGYTRAARLIDQMEEEGIVGPPRGASPREILVDLN